MFLILNELESSHEVESNHEVGILILSVSKLVHSNICSYNAHNVAG